MRNLRAHPVTLEEILSSLKRMLDREAAKEIPGDMTPLLLRKAINGLVAHEEFARSLGEAFNLSEPWINDRVAIITCIKALQSDHERMSRGKAELIDHIKRFAPRDEHGHYGDEVAELLRKHSR